MGQMGRSQRLMMRSTDPLWVSPLEDARSVSRPRLPIRSASSHLSDLSASLSWRTIIGGIRIRSVTSQAELRRSRCTMLVLRVGRRTHCAPSIQPLATSGRLCVLRGTSRLTLGRSTCRVDLPPRLRPSNSRSPSSSRPTFSSRPTSSSGSPSSSPVHTSLFIFSLLLLNSFAIVRV